MGNTGTRFNFSHSVGNKLTNSNLGLVHSATSSLTSTSPRKSPVIDHSQSTTAIQLQKDLQSLHKQQREYMYLTQLTNFDEETIRLLHFRFQCIDKIVIADGEISINEFAHILDMPQSCVLLKQFFRFIDSNDMGSLNFRNFAEAMSMLDVRADEKKKIQLSFFLYDVNNDGKIDHEECRNMVVLALHEIGILLDTEQIDSIVEETFSRVDTKNDGIIDYEEYEAYCLQNPRILAPFRIDVKRLVQYEKDNRRGHRYSTGTAEGKVRFFQNSNAMSRKKKLLKKSIKKVKKKVGKLSATTTERVRPIYSIEDIGILNDNIWSKSEVEFQEYIELNRPKNITKKSHSVFVIKKTSSNDEHVNKSFLSLAGCKSKSNSFCISGGNGSGNDNSLVSSMTELTDTGSESCYSIESDDELTISASEASSDISQLRPHSLGNKTDQPSVIRPISTVERQLSLSADNAARSKRKKEKYYHQMLHKISKKKKKKKKSNKLSTDSVILMKKKIKQNRKYQKSKKSRIRKKRNSRSKDNSRQKQKLRVIHKRRNRSKSNINNSCYNYMNVIKSDDDWSGSGSGSGKIPGASLVISSAIIMKNMSDNNDICSNTGIVDENVHKIHHQISSTATDIDIEETMVDIENIISAEVDDNLLPSLPIVMNMQTKSDENNLNFSNESIKFILCSSGDDVSVACKDNK